LAKKSALGSPLNRETWVAPGLDSETGDPRRKR
jgi:hypothetical protein